MKKVLTTLSLLFLLAVGGLAYAVFYSSAPFKAAARVLEKNGFEVGAVTGSLNSGFSVSRLAKKGDDIEFVAEGIKLSYNTLLDAYVNKRVVVKDFDITKLHLKLEC